MDNTKDESVEVEEVVGGYVDVEGGAVVVVRGAGATACGRSTATPGRSEGPAPQAAVRRIVSDADASSVARIR